MRGALGTWFALARHRDHEGPARGRVPGVLAAIAFAASTLAVLTVAGGVQAFLARAALPDASSDDVAYPFLAFVSVGLLVVPVATLGAAAARLTVARRDRRLSRLRLAGATSTQVATIALLEAALQASAGAVLGVVANVATVPALAQLRFQGRTFEPGELRLGPLPVLATAACVLAVALLSCATSLRRVAITPLGVAQRLPQKGLSWVRLLPVLLLGVGFVVAFSRLRADLDTVFALVVLLALLAGAFAVFNLVGPFLISLLGRVVAARAQSVATLLAARRMVDDPRSTWRSVGGISLVTFVAGCLSVAPGMTSGDAVPGDHLLADVGTGAVVTMVIAAVLAAVSTGVTQASRVLDSAPHYRALHLAGTDVGVLHAARSRETWIPLVVTMGAATLLAMLVVSPLAFVLQRAPVGVALFLGAAVVGAGLVLLAARASGPLLVGATHLG